MAQRFDQTYKVKQGDDLGDPAFWNLRFQDLDLRLAAAEALFGKMDDAVAQVTSLGINRLNTTFAPLIAELTSQINSALALVAEAQAEVGALQGTGAGSISAAAASVMAELDAFVVQAQGLVGSLQTLGAIEGGSFP